MAAMWNATKSAGGSAMGAMWMPMYGSMAGEMVPWDTSGADKEFKAETGRMLGRGALGALVGSLIGRYFSGPDNTLTATAAGGLAGGALGVMSGRRV